MVKLDFIGANPNVKPEGIEPADAVFSYFKGPRNNWKTGLKTYKGVIYRDLWPGIDLVYSGGTNRLKYTFNVSPGADPKQIRLAYCGAGSVAISDTGGLVVNTPVRDFSDERPISWQDVDGKRIDVKTTCRLNHNRSADRYEYGFTLGSYNAERPLVIDPAVIVYCAAISAALVEIQAEA